MPILRSLRERLRVQEEEIFYGEEMHPFIAYDGKTDATLKELPTISTANTPEMPQSTSHKTPWWQRLLAPWASGKFRSA